jgi:CheY-like chemotaxis protein
MSAAADELIAVLPYARRYARALTGGQREGDAVVARALTERRSGAASDLPVRLGLYAGISRLAPGGSGASGISLLQRKLLLLTALEELPVEAAARVLSLDNDVAERELAEARGMLKAAAATDVLIIEDEPVIAMDLRLLVESCGHRVVGVAESEAAAERLAREEAPKLILADVNLGRGGNGIVAVRRILDTASIPVIFVTAYPELLLTAEGIEPAFVMRKPFDRITLAICTYQAITAGHVPLN